MRLNAVVSHPSQRQTLCQGYQEQVHSTTLERPILEFVCANRGSLLSEIVLNPVFFDDLRREEQIIVAGPSTLSALLNSLSVGFKL